MVEKISVLSRSVPLRRITCCHVFLLLSSANGQPTASGNVSQSGQYGFTNFDPSMAIVIVVLIFIFFFVGTFSVFLRHCSDLPPDTAYARRIGAPNRSGLDHAVFEKFPVFVYSAVKGIKIGRDTLECAICLSEFKDDEELRLLPKCNHVFHPECIDMWLLSHVTCPVCRANLTSESEKNKILAPEMVPPRAAEQPNQPYADESPSEVVISVDDEESSDSQPVPILPNTSHPINRESRIGISGKFPRSHSTGHSLVQPGENIERYTLRLPEEVRRQIMERAKVLKRTASFNVVLPTEGSSRRGNQSGGEGSGRGRQIIEQTDRWPFSMNPPFVSRGGSVKPSKVDNEEGFC